MIMIDMEMPRCCIECPILRENDWCGIYCPFVCEENNINIKQRTDRPSDCPLKEIEKSEEVNRMNKEEIKIGDEVLHNTERYIVVAKSNG